MPLRAYEDWDPSPDSAALVRRADEICREYAAQGFDLTLRQLYYQYVARGWIENTDRSYKRLGEIINRARLSGRLDWRYIVDRTRSLRALSHWDSPAEIIQSAADSYRIDRWEDQDVRVEVWVEKEALAGVIARTAERYDVAYFSCRGYVSQSELWAAAQRHLSHMVAGQSVVVLHLGDHDPSGIDMTRDIRDRLERFIGTDLGRYRDYGSPADNLEMTSESLGVDPPEVRRIALTIDQVEQYGPPRNPAKLTDARARGYIAEYGRSSWELDALEPTVLDELIAHHIESLWNPHRWEARRQRESEERSVLTDFAATYDGEA